MPDENGTDLKVIEADFSRENQAREQIRYAQDLREIEGLGVGHLTIAEAAELIAQDLWFAGALTDFRPTPEFEGDLYDPALLAALSDEITEFEANLRDATEKGSLKASFVRREWDGTLDTRRTRLPYKELCAWFRERGHEPGEAFEAWEFQEDQIEFHVSHQVSQFRAAFRNPRGKVRGFSALHDLVEIKELHSALWKYTDIVDILHKAYAQIDQLVAQTASGKQAGPSFVDRPFTMRERRTLLTIIAALCEEARVNVTERGAAQRIKELTERIGVPVHDDTIRKVLGQIPEALETGK